MVRKCVIVPLPHDISSCIVSIQKLLMCLSFHTSLSIQVDDIQNGDLSLSKYGLEAAADKLDLRNQVGVAFPSRKFSHYSPLFDTQEVARFVAELVLVKQAMEKVSVEGWGHFCKSLLSRHSSAPGVDKLRV